MADESFDPYYTWLGIPADERPIHFYRLLGIQAFEDNPEVISNAVDRRMGHLRTFQNGKRAQASQKLLNELSRANVCLLDVDKKAIYDQELRDFLAARNGPPTPEANEEHDADADRALLSHEQVRLEPKQLSESDELHLSPLDEADKQPGQQTQSTAVKKQEPRKLGKLPRRPDAETEPALPWWRQPPIVIGACAVCGVLLVIGIVLAAFSFSRNRQPAPPPPPGRSIVLPNDKPIDRQPVPNLNPDPEPRDPTTVGNPNVASNGQNTNPHVSPTPEPSEPDEPQPQPNDPHRSPEPTEGVVTLPAPVPPELSGDYFAVEMKQQDNVLLPDIGNLEHGAFTVEMWLQWRSLPGVYRLFSCESLEQEGAQQLAVDISLTQQSVIFMCAGRLLAESEFKPVLKFTTPRLDTKNRFHHVAFTIGAEDARLFVDGARSMSLKLATDSVVPDDTALWVGARPRSNRQFFGNVRALRVSTSVRYSEEFVPPTLLAQDDATACLLDFRQPRDGKIQDLVNVEHAAILNNGRWSEHRGATRRPVSFPDPHEPKPAHPDSREPQPEEVAGPVFVPVPKPKPDLLQTATNAVKDAYRDKLDDAKNSAKQKALAEQLLAAGQQATNGTADQYALFDIAADLASRGGEYTLAWQVLKELSLRFDDSVLERKQKALETATRRFKATKEHKQATRYWVLLVDEAVDEGEFELARKYAGIANGSALKSFDSDMKKYVAEGLEVIKELEKAYQERIPDRESFESNTPDPLAAARWGRFICGYQNHWSGLKQWQHGDDELANLAKRELNASDNVADKQLLAEEWWRAADSQQHILPQRNFRRRSAHWYATVFDELQGVAKLNAVNRMRQVAVDDIAVQRGKTVDLVALHKTQPRPSGWFRYKSQFGITKARGNAEHKIPLAPTGDFEIHAVVERREGDGAFGIKFPVLVSRAASLLLGDGENDGSGLKGLTGAREDVGMSGDFSNEEQHAIVIRVNRGDITRVVVEMDGRKRIEWSGELQEFPSSTAGQGFQLFTEPNNTIVFHHLQVIPRTGRLELTNSP